MAETRIPRKHYRCEVRRTILREAEARYRNELHVGKAVFVLVMLNSASLDPLANGVRRDT